MIELLYNKPISQMERNMNYSPALRETLEFAAISFHMKGAFGVAEDGREGILLEKDGGVSAVWNPLESSPQAFDLLGEHKLNLTYRDGKAVIDSERHGHLLEVDFQSPEVAELIALQGGYSALGLSNQVNRMMAGRYAVTQVAALMGHGLVKTIGKCLG
jgi:hypothetical protein